MARGWHCTKLSLSSALLLSFSGMYILLLLLFLFIVSVLFRYVFLLLLESFVDAPLIFFCPADHGLDWQPRILLGMLLFKEKSEQTLLFLTLSALVANPPKPLFYTVANPARGLLNREKIKIKISLAAPPPPPPRAARSEKKKKKKHATHPHV